jgi:hypothetical protein
MDWDKSNKTGNIPLIKSLKVRLSKIFQILIKYSSQEHENDERGGVEIKWKKSIFKNSLHFRNK